MKYIKNTTDFYIEEPTVLSLGKFDGIHRGHELLMEQLAAQKDRGLAAVIFTFDIPPRRNISHIEARVLTTNQEKMHILEQIGVDYLVECPFTEVVMCMEAEDFIAKIVRQLHVKCFVVGEDFRFGHNRRGDYHMLLAYAQEYGYEVYLPRKNSSRLLASMSRRLLSGRKSIGVSRMWGRNRRLREIIPSAWRRICSTLPGIFTGKRSPWNF